MRRYPKKSGFLSIYFLYGCETAIKKSQSSGLPWEELNKTKTIDIFTSWFFSTIS